VRARLQAPCRLLTRGSAPWHAELSIGNIVRRVLHIIREEAASAEATGEDGGDGERADEVARCAGARVPSLATLLEVVPEAPSPPPPSACSWRCALAHALAH
jgi:hypothetical protein